MGECYMEEWIKKIREAGIVGAGGAGFPAYAKYNAHVDTFIANGAECEPLLNTDQAIMMRHPQEVVMALETVGKSMGAKNIYIAIKQKHQECIEKIDGAIKNLSASVIIYPLRDYYPAGDEFMLTYEVTRRVIPPAGIPLNVGVCVANVGTLYNAYNAIFNEEPVTYKYVTVNGEVGSPGVICVPIGTTLRDCIERVGGATLKDFSVIVGGPMMGRIYPDGKEALDLPVRKTTGGVIVLPVDHPLIFKKTIPESVAVKRARAACIQCRYCSDMCPRNLLGHQLYPHLVMRTVSNVENAADMRMTLLCSECNVCELYACPMGINPRTMNSVFKSKLREAGVRYDYSGYLLKVNDMIDYRRVPVYRLVMRLNLDRYSQDVKYYGTVEDIKSVKIMLRDGPGRTARPIVAQGDEVLKGQKIADVDDDALGVPVHASMAGTVTQITDEYITIENTGVKK
jgi:SLBB domain./Respiratory-chain NADH dehydrogenase 51 Kd subunit.